MEEGYLDVLLSDDDAVCDRLDDLPLLLKRQIGPTVGEVSRFSESFTPGEGPYPKDVEFCLEAGKLVLKLVPSFGQRTVASTEVLLRELLGEIELKDVLVLGLNPAEFRLGALDQSLLVAHRFDRGCIVRLDLLGRDEEVVELLAVHRFEVGDWHLVPALLADVLGGVRADVHLLAAGAVGEAGKEVDSLLSSWCCARPLRKHEALARVPKLLRDDLLNLGVDPFALGLQVPALRPVVGAGVVLAVNPLRR